MAVRLSIARSITLLVLLAGLVGAVSPGILPLGVVDPGVLADTLNGQEGHFLVILRAQADPRRPAAPADRRRPGAADSGWQDQGQRVVEGLRLTAKSSQAGVLAQLDSLGVPYRPYWIVDLVAVTGGRGVVAALAARPEVAEIVPDRAFRAPLEGPDEQAPKPAVSQQPDTVEWGLAKVGAPALWSMGFTGQGIVYANADTGVMWDHPALVSHYRGWNGAAADHNYNWWDAIHADIDGTLNPCGMNTRAPCDDFGHGTHTTGTAVGSDGGSNQIGMAPGAEWIACRNMDSGVGRPSTYIECLQFFIAPTDLNGQNPDPSRRPDVISNSYGCPPTELCGPHDLQAAVEAVRAAGIFMAVSAGNDGSTNVNNGCGTVNDPPALEASVFTMGMTNSSDALDVRSSRGPVTVDGSSRRKPDLVAPGVSVRSAWNNGGYQYASGTSMASPHVAGAVALLWSAVPGLRRDIRLTETLLEQSAFQRVTYQSNQYCPAGGAFQIPNSTFGYGRLDVLAAYRLATQSYIIYLPFLDNGYGK